ncbi:MAG: S9 family peptidase [bacterium]
MSIADTAAYGTWPSPITAELIVAETVRLGQIALDGEAIYWIELRPWEGGRNVVVRRTPDGEIEDMTPEGYDARTRVHEYGGGAFVVNRGNIYFCNDADQRLYHQTPEGTARPLTPVQESRFADGIVDEKRRRLICIRENHSNPDTEATNQLVSVDLAVGNGSEISILAGGSDFYSTPALSPDGEHLAWLAWNHPNMPWDGTELWLAKLDESGTPIHPRKVAGGAAESIFQPQWSPGGQLYFVSDRSGWWNLYRLHDDQSECVWEREAELGSPQWVFGMSTYGFESEPRLICTVFEQGEHKLAMVDTKTCDTEIIDLPFTHIEQLRASRGQAVFIAGSPISANAIVRLDINTRQFEILRRSAVLNFESTYLSRPEPIEFPTEGDLTAHAFFYPPQNLEVSGPQNERPPLIVKSHGGPTSSASTALELKIQFWTSRGFAVLDVNYGGSAGYGRAYRERLNGRWGIVDVADCVNAAQYAVEQGLVDGQRVAIAGGSAGGYTTLCALTFQDFFKAGASYYGISDLEALATETHKFESRYLHRLIGPYPERRDLYLERSPIHFTDKISCPVIVMQGTEDKVVPPNQSLLMVDALRKKGLAVAYLAFVGEQHGFRKAESIQRALEAELYFYGKVFHFRPADEIEPVRIDNLPEG